jgi:hypothetical protein
MSGDYAIDADGLVALDARYPRLHFDLEEGAAARTFEARFDLVRIGREASRVAAPTGETRGPGGLRDRVRRRLRSYPLAVAAYRALVKRSR